MDNDVSTTALQPAHVDTLVRIHTEAFPNFFLSSLGPGFLRNFYLGYLTDETAVSVVAVRAGGEPVGGVVGTVQPAGFYSRLLRKRGFHFALAAAGASLRRPRTIPRLLRAMNYRGDSSGSGSGGALLASICIDPAYQGTGLGRRLLGEWEAAATRKGSHSAYLTTDAVGNDGVIRFYEKAGWVSVGSFVTDEGRKMNRYEKGLK